MKYTTEVIINKDLDTCITAIQSKEAAFKWIKGLEAFDLIEGEEGKVNSKYKMVFKNGEKTSEMTETLVKVNPPTNITTTYEMGSVKNVCVNSFKGNEVQTTYSMETSFKFGFFITLFIWLLKPMFKKETLSGMVSFKNYVESLD